MKNRVFAYALILVMLAGFLPGETAFITDGGNRAAAEAAAAENSGAETAPEETALSSGYGNHVSGSLILTGAGQVQVMLGDRKRDPSDPEGWKKEVRCCSLDPETGLFETGEGREPGTEAELVKWLEDGYGYTVQLKEPGKYVLSGIPVYVLNTEDERHTALLDELDQAVIKAEGKTEKITGTNLYKWLQKRVKSKMPKDRPELAEICRDPMNALLTGYAAPEAYLPLLGIVMSQVHIETVAVDGKKIIKKQEQDGTWAACQMDGKWLWADPALDAGGTRYFGKTEEEMQKDHILSEGAEAFVGRFIRSNYIDVLLREDRELSDRLRLANRNEGSYVELQFIDGPLYSLGPSGPVTVHIYSNMEGMLPEENDPNLLDNLVNTYFRTRYRWDPEYNFFNVITNSYQEVEENLTKHGDIELVAYDREAGTMTFRFLKPGLYTGFIMGDSFCVLDPEDPTQVRVAEMLDEAREIPRGETEKETVRNVMKWIAPRLKYDYEAYSSIKKMMNPELMDADEFASTEMDSSASQDPYSALATGVSVCGGYANLFTLLLRNMGIPAMEIISNLTFDEVNHAWNIIRMDGKWLYADATWDDKGGSAGSRYFAKDYEQTQKDHAKYPIGGPESLVDGLFENTAYGIMAHRFDTRYGVRLNLPDRLRSLPGDVSGFDFPEKNPTFIQFEEPSFFDDRVEWHIYKHKVLYSFTVWNMRGENYKSSSGDIPRDWSFICESGYFKNLIYDVTLRDYEPGNRPTDKPFRQQDYTWVRTEPETVKLSYSVPMKRNEIRGFSEKSCRTYIYDGEMNKTGMIWELEKDGTTISVSAFFNGEGRTVRTGVTVRPPDGGNSIAWVNDPDGAIQSLRIDDGDNTYYLERMDDLWTMGWHEEYMRSLVVKYPEIRCGEPLPEGVHIYRISRDDLVQGSYAEYIFRPNLFGGEPIATRDELLFWDEDGRLQFNPDAKDLKGDPIVLDMGSNPDLSMCTRIGIQE